MENQFVVEGAKNVLELLKSDFEIVNLYLTQEFHLRFQKELIPYEAISHEVKETDLNKVGTFANNNAVLAVVKIPTWAALDYAKSVLAFDRIKDPGNLGTVIRIADWYGFDQVVCSPESVDGYNPKVISASMGSFTRVRVHYGPLNEILPKANKVYGTTLQGQNIHQIKFQEPAVIVFGNESLGLSDDLKLHLDEEVFIPGYGGAESLNVAISTAVFCDNYRRLLSQ